MLAAAVGLLFAVDIRYRMNLIHCRNAQVAQIS